MTSATCSEMKVGQVFVCEKCGLELKVMKECKDVGKSPEHCNCETNGGTECCNITCCGEELKLKKESSACHKSR